jgi:hypothetical protein
MLREVPSAELVEAGSNESLTAPNRETTNSGALGPGYLTEKPEAVQTKPPT